MLMEVKRNVAEEETPLDNFVDFLVEGIKLLSAMDDFLNPDIDGVEQALSMVLKPEVDQIFLKQFPDSSGLKAVYQGLVEAPAEVKDLHSVSLLNGEYEYTNLSYTKLTAFHLSRA